MSNPHDPANPQTPITAEQLDVWQKYASKVDMDDAFELAAIVSRLVDVARAALVVHDTHVSQAATKKERWGAVDRLIETLQGIQAVQSAQDGGATK